MGLCCLAVNTQVILRGIFHIQLFFSVIKMLEFVLFIYFFLEFVLIYRFVCTIVTWFGLRLNLVIQNGFFVCWAVNTNDMFLTWK